MATITTCTTRGLLFIFLLCLFLSCTHHQEGQAGYRDTVVQHYLAMVNSAGRYDTTEDHYKMLTAYVRNDTFALRRLDSVITGKEHRRQNWEVWRADLPLPDLQQLHSEEAYRFVFSLLGAPAYEAITVFEKDSAFRLHYLYYVHQRESATFQKIKEFERRITQEQWQTVTQKLRDADFYGLKSDVDYRGQDGSDLTVFGYYKSGYVERSHSVHRWGPSTLVDAFHYLYYYVLTKKERRVH